MSSSNPMIHAVQMLLALVEIATAQVDALEQQLGPTGSATLQELAPHMDRELGASLAALDSALERLHDGLSGASRSVEGLRFDLATVLADRQTQLAPVT